MRVAKKLSHAQELCTSSGDGAAAVAEHPLLGQHPRTFENSQSYQQMHFDGPNSLWRRELSYVQFEFRCGATLLQNVLVIQFQNGFDLQKPSGVLYLVLACAVAHRPGSTLPERYLLHIH